MKEVEFQGKRLDNGEWINGCLIQDYAQARITTLYGIGRYNWEMCECKSYEVARETVGQFIGVLDMSEEHQKLYEDDVVEITIFNPFQPEKIIVQKRRKIEFENGVFGVKWNHVLMPFCQFAANNTRIIKIGNIWDNPELVNDDE